MSEYLFDNKKYLLFDSILNHKQIDIFNKIIQKSFDFDLAPNFTDMLMRVTNKNTKEEKKSNFSPLGMYDIKNKTFSWFPYTLEYFIKKSFIPYSKIYETLYNSKETLDLIFNKEEIKLEHKYRLAIPYLIGLFHKFNIIEFEDEKENIYSYCLVDLCIYEHKDTIDKIRNDIYNTQFIIHNL
jgi:hypothetical protein